MSEAFGVTKFRKEYGDLEDFSKSLEEFGQFYEIIKTKDGVTIDGDRREAAFEKFLKNKPDCKLKKLREYRIPFTFSELEKNGLFSLMQVEANTQRKGFTIEETNNIRKYIENIRKSGNLPERFKGIETREIVGKITQRGARNISKITDIMESVENKKLDPKYIQRIDSGSTSINTVYKIATQEQRSLPKVEIPQNQADCFQIDFPIKYDAGPGIRGAAENHYPPQPLEKCLEDATKFPIADSSIIFLWITKPMRYDSQTINGETMSTEEHFLKALRVNSKDEFVWIKDKFANGHYTRSQHEILLICFRGKPIAPAKAFSSVIQAPTAEHSSKPDVWPMIKEMYPGRKYYECYRRDITEGVDGFGNQTRGIDFGGKTDKVTIVTMEKSGDKLTHIKTDEIKPIEKLRNKRK